MSTAPARCTPKTGLTFSYRLPCRAAVTLPLQDGFVTVLELSDGMERCGAVLTDGDRRSCWTPWERRAAWTRTSGYPCMVHVGTVKLKATPLLNGTRSCMVHTRSYMYPCTREVRVTTLPRLAVNAMHVHATAWTSGHEHSATNHTVEVLTRTPCCLVPPHVL